MSLSSKLQTLRVSLGTPQTWNVRSEGGSGAPELCGWCSKPVSSQVIVTGRSRVLVPRGTCRHCDFVLHGLPVASTELQAPGGRGPTSLRSVPLSRKTQAPEAAPTRSGATAFPRPPGSGGNAPYGEPPAALHTHCNDKRTTYFSISYYSMSRRANLQLGRTISTDPVLLPL